METITTDLVVNLITTKAERAHYCGKFHLSKALQAAAGDADFLEYAVKAAGEYQDMAYTDETGLTAELLAEDSVCRVLQDEFNINN